MKQTDLSVGMPYTNKENDELLKQGVLKKLYSSKSIEKFIREKVHGSPYSIELEKNMLTLLGSNFETIEEYVFSIKDKNRDDLSLLEIYGIEVYAKKIFSKNGVDKNVEVDLFEHGKGPVFGEAVNDCSKLTIYNHPANKSLKGILRTLHHESSHIIMYNMITSNNVGDMIELDEDLLDYCKDDIMCRLSNIYDKDSEESYYDENQYILSYEYDAQFRALCMESILYGRKSELDHNAEKLFDGYDKKDINSAGMKIIGDYSASKTRMYREQEYTINDLFLKMINSAKYGHVHRAFELAPALHYEYNVNFNDEAKTFSVKRKTINELVHEYEQARGRGDIKTCKVYLKIVDKMCDERYEGKKSEEYFEELNGTMNEEIKSYVRNSREKREMILNTYELKYVEGEQVKNQNPTSR